MGSLVSVVVANIVMEDIETRAIETVMLQSDYVAESNRNRCSLPQIFGYAMLMTHL